MESNLFGLPRREFIVKSGILNKFANFFKKTREWRISKD